MNDMLDAILQAVQSVDPVLRTVLAGLAIMLETSILVGLVVPGDTVVIVASTAVVNPLVDPVEAIALAIAVVLGALVGESIGFWLGRVFGPRIRASRLGARIGERNWARAERYLARRGGIAVFVSRFLPVLHSLVPLTVGMSPMSYRRFLSWTAPACVLWAALYVGVGSLAAGTYRELSDRIHGAGYVFVAILVAFSVLVLGGKKLLQRLERRHMHEDENAEG